MQTEQVSHSSQGKQMPAFLLCGVGGYMCKCTRDEIANMDYCQETHLGCSNLRSVKDHSQCTILRATSKQGQGRLISKHIPSRLPKIPPHIFPGSAALHVHSPGCIKGQIVAKLFSSGPLKAKPPVMFLKFSKVWKKKEPCINHVIMLL